MTPSRRRCSGQPLWLLWAALALALPPFAPALHAQTALAPDATRLLVEPDASDTLEENLNPVGRLYYSGSTFLCVPNALSQPGGHALGAQAGEAAVQQVITEAGFTRFRRVAQSAFNLVYEIKP